MLKTRISVPALATRDSIITIKTLVSHPMETGYRSDNLGKAIPRNILTEFTCHYNNRLVIRSELNPGVAANPYFAFQVRVDQSGSFKFQWKDQHGEITTAERNITVK